MQFYETAYLAMGFNKDGYDDSNEMGRALPRAIGIKREEGISKRIADEKAGLRKDPRRDGDTKKGSIEGEANDRRTGRDRSGRRSLEGGMMTVSYGLYGGTGRSLPVRPREGH